MKKKILCLFISLLALVACTQPVDQSVPEMKKNPPSLIRMNRVVLQRSKNAIRRGDSYVMKAYENLIGKADAAVTAIESMDMTQMAEGVQTLGLAYFFSDEELYASAAARLLKTWFLNDDAKLKGARPTVDKTLCLAEMLDAVILLQDSPSWTDEDREKLMAWFSDYNEYILSDKASVAYGNREDERGTAYDYQSCMYAMFTNQSAIARKRIDVITRSRIDRLQADGAMAGSNWNAGTQNILYLVQLAFIGERLGLNLWEYESPRGVTLRKAIEYFFPLLVEGKAEAASYCPKALVTVLMRTADRFGVKAYTEEIYRLVTVTGERYNPEASVNALIYPILNGPVTTDADLFEALNLDTKGLEAVKRDVQKGDYEAAKRDFVAYLKKREKPVWFFNWRDFNDVSNRDSTFDCTYVDQIAANILPSCGTPKDYGGSEIIDWSINASDVKYIEWTWQLSRHGYWASLGQAYWATGNEKYAKAFVHQMKSWVRFNTLHDFADNVGYSRWRTIETGIRTLSAWPNAFFYFLPSPSFDDESIILMVKSFYEHAIHLRAYPQRNNWLTMEMNGLFHTGILFPEFKEADDWCRFACHKMYEEEKSQFYEDGAQVELAPSYHDVSVNSMMGIYRIGKLNNYPLPADYSTRLENAYTYYVKTFLPDGTMPALNDGHWRDLRPIMARGLEYMPHRSDMRYLVSGGKEGVKPDFTSVWMPWAGWYVMRSGWNADDLYAMFEVGPYSPAHQHEDKLSFFLFGYGNLLITEAGKYDYDTSQWRKYVLSARAHNLTRVDGKDQHRGGLKDERVRMSLEPMTNRWISNEQSDFGEGWYDEGFGASNDSTVTQYRALTFVKNKYWLLLDVFTPADESEHTYDTWFHFNTTDARVMAAPYCVQSAQQGAANIAVIPLRSEGIQLKTIVGQETPEVQGWVSDLWPNGQGEKYKIRKAATTEITRKAQGRLVEPYLLFPIRADEVLPVSEVKTMGENQYDILYKDGTKDSVVFTLDEENCLKTFTVITPQGVIDVLKQ